MQSTTIDVTTQLAVQVDYFKRIMFNKSWLPVYTYLSLVIYDFVSSLNLYCTAVQVWMFNLKHHPDDAHCCTARSWCTCILPAHILCTPNLLPLPSTPLLHWCLLWIYGSFLITRPNLSFSTSSSFFSSSSAFTGFFSPSLPNFVLLRTKECNATIDRT